MKNHVSLIRRAIVRAGTVVALAALAAPLAFAAKTVVFWQPDFPTIASQPLERATLDNALNGLDPQFADLAALKNPETLAGADLLVLPYGSALPADAWPAIEPYLHQGGNLLVLGGQPFRVPISQHEGKFIAGRPQDTYARILDFRHTYEVPVPATATFAWKSGYPLPAISVRAQKFFTVEGRLEGLGYMLDPDGLRVAAPVVVRSGPLHGGRIVALDFTPEPGYWSSADGLSLLRTAATYASQGATALSVEVLFSTIRTTEPPQISVHLRAPQSRAAAPAEVRLTIASAGHVVDTATLPVASLSGTIDLAAPFHKPLPAGFYTVTAVLNQAGSFRESYQTGFWVAETSSLAAGPVLGVHGDFLTRDGAPFFPVGTNYFTTEEDGWDFSGPRNAAVWDADFAAMAAHGVNFVRTGVWMPPGKFLEPSGGVNERFLRNLEAYLLCAQRHAIAINFTFFAFSPRTTGAFRPDPGAPEPNPYTDPNSVAAQQAYVRSVVARFKDVPWLSYDLINEPSFSNPQHIFHGNYPNGDATEVAAWRKWLRGKYADNLAALADAWAVTPAQLGSFDAIPLPSGSDINYDRYRNPLEVRVVDYGLFAQDAFTGWVHTMVQTIRDTGSHQLIDVGQDEGGVMDRVLNQFYAAGGVSFTTNHTYWEDDALLWDSVAAKRVGTPNITGETGYQPVSAPDGTWRYDEMTGLSLIERKWALGFAAGSSGALQWDWAREPDFGMERSDGSAKLWENMMRDLGAFAAHAAPAATALKLPDVALVLPQSAQLSVVSPLAIEAQKTAVRALYGYARSQAYAVGEYQIDLLGSPKLILLPSPMALSEPAWQAIETKIRAGAVLLVTGPFGEDAHFHATGRQHEAGLPYTEEPLTLRDEAFHFPGGDLRLSFPGNKTTVLNRAALPDHSDWVEKPLGKGRILFAALPLELNGNLDAIGAVYRYALNSAGVTPVYTTTLDDPGILICPTMFPDATLYVLTSESSQTRVDFKDQRSGRTFTGTLDSGHAAILLIGTNGKILASYRWNGK